MHVESLSSKQQQQNQYRQLDAWMHTLKTLRGALGAHPVTDTGLQGPAPGPDSSRPSMRDAVAMLRSQPAASVAKAAPPGSNPMSIKLTTHIERLWLQQVGAAGAGRKGADGEQRRVRWQPGVWEGATPKGEQTVTACGAASPPPAQPPRPLALSPSRRTATAATVAHSLFHQAQRGIGHSQVALLQLKQLALPRRRLRLPLVRLSCRGALPLVRLHLALPLLPAGRSGGGGGN